MPTIITKIQTECTAANRVTRQHAEKKVTKPVTLQTTGYMTLDNSV